jgi:hypothetical protein
VEAPKANEALNVATGDQLDPAVVLDLVPDLFKIGARRIASLCGACDARRADGGSGAPGGISLAEFTKLTREVVASMKSKAAEDGDEAEDDD